MMFFYVLAIFSTASLAAAFEYKQCDGVEANVLKLKKFDLKTNPIKVPGLVTADLQWELLQTPKANQKYTLSVESKMKLPNGGWVDTPCLENGLGSCSFDFCDLIEKTGKYMTTKGLPCGDTFPCSCKTMKKTTYTVNGFQLNIPAVKIGGDVNIYTDYKTDVKLVHTDKPEEVLSCIHFEYKLESSKCEGVFCN